MEPTFQEIADFKTREGQPARVVTAEWILANYDGIDHADRVRQYIRDVYLYQGLRYALLGGDTGLVPTRIAINRFQNRTLIIFSSVILRKCLVGTYYLYLS